MTTRLFALLALLATGCADSVDSAGSAPRGGGGASAPATGAGTLTAGEWRDNDDWPAWQSMLLQGARIALAGYDLEVEHRVSVQLIDDAGPAVDVEVRLLAGTSVLWVARSNAQGRAVLFAPSDAEGPLEIELPDATRRPVEIGQTVRVEVRDGGPARGLDAMFVIDTTGSMCDELAWIQSELVDVVERTERGMAGLRVRTSVNVYRDHGDAYVVQNHPFRSSASQAAEDLRSHSCGGGGDRPEAMDEALFDGVRSHRWSERAAGRLLFLVTDAPPHRSPDALARLGAIVEIATVLGIRIVPVAASGMDRDTEFLLRGLAILTGGTYVFLTDDSGVGNAHLDPSVGEYEVEPFNDLLVRLLREAAGAE